MCLSSTTPRWCPRKTVRRDTRHLLSFCRSVSDMGFFGIQNGRESYCTHYYKAMESDSTECDAVCEDNPMKVWRQSRGGADALHDYLDEVGEISEECTQ
eukprot:7713474-Heterocapsa_arctica.AAC.1